MNKIKAIRNVCAAVFCIYVIVNLVYIEKIFDGIKLAFIGEKTEVLGHTITAGGSFWGGMHMLISFLYPFVIMLLLIISLNAIMDKLEKLEWSAETTRNEISSVKFENKIAPISMVANSQGLLSREIIENSKKYALIATFDNVIIDFQYLEIVGIKAGIRCNVVPVGEKSCLCICLPSGRPVAEVRNGKDYEEIKQYIIDGNIAIAAIKQINPLQISVGIYSIG